MRPEGIDHLQVCRYGNGQTKGCNQDSTGEFDEPEKKETPRHRLRAVAFVLFLTTCSISCAGPPRMRKQSF